ncbi:MAG: zinc ribbon domain-containing protein [Chloroflexi bacterium]|nr:zinc ribbon domain-containing protein [Chloroflexota bacterium]
MKCTNCGFDNPAGLRFCGQCANELSQVCANCGAENPTRFHYCGQCASPLASNEASAHPTLVPPRAVRDLADRILGPTPQLQGERRNITVLFVDVSSFTPLAEKLDPEVVYAAIDQYLHALVEQVELYGGQVDKFTGDGLMALFGAPLAHENHAERALRAGLGMQRTLGQLAEAGALPFALRARIGVNTGQVVRDRLPAGNGHLYRHGRHRQRGRPAGESGRAWRSAGQPGRLRVNPSDLQF